MRHESISIPTDEAHKDNLFDIWIDKQESAGKLYENGII